MDGGEREREKQCSVIVSPRTITPLARPASVSRAPVQSDGLANRRATIQPQVVAGLPVAHWPARSRTRVGPSQEPMSGLDVAIQRSVHVQYLCLTLTNPDITLFRPLLSRRQKCNAASVQLAAACPSKSSLALLIRGNNLIVRLHCAKHQVNLASHGTLHPPTSAVQPPSKRPSGKKISPQR